MGLTGTPTASGGRSRAAAPRWCVLCNFARAGGSRRTLADRHHLHDNRREALQVRLCPYYPHRARANAIAARRSYTVPNEQRQMCVIPDSSPLRLRADGAPALTACASCTCPPSTRSSPSARTATSEVTPTIPWSKSVRRASKLACPQFTDSFL